MHLILKKGAETLFEGDHVCGSDAFLEEIQEMIRGKELETILDLTFNALGRRGYALPRVYLSKGENQLLLHGAGLPPEMRKMEINSSLLEEIVRKKMTYINDECRKDSSLWVKNDPMFLVPEQGLVASYFPLMGRLEGVLVANYPLSLALEETRLFRRVAFEVGSAMLLNMERERYQKELHLLRTKMEDIKKRDNATGLYNKQAFHKYLAHCMSLVHAQEKHYYLLLADLDNLKKFNEEFGHAEGDFLVAGVGEYWRSLPESHGYRVGGDKFALVVPATGNRNDFYMLDLARKVKKDIQKLPVPEGAAPVTASLGLALSDQSFPDSEAWYAQGNYALAEAKKERNCGIYLIEGMGQTVHARV